MKWIAAVALLLLPLSVQAKCAWVEYEVSGRVLLPDGRGVPGTPVTVAWEDMRGPHGDSATADEQGRFRVQLWVLSFSGPGEQPGTESCGYVLRRAAVGVNVPNLDAPAETVEFDGNKGYVELVIGRSDRSQGSTSK